MKEINQSPVVDFVVIGAMKAGSTTLVDYLQQNEQLCFAKPKEPQYFSRHYDEWSLDSYESLWEFPEKICGEASTCYSRWPHYQNVPERLYNYNPDIKIVYILRNPIDRAYSHYRHNVLVDGINFASFDEAIDKSDEIIMSSCYMTQIKKYLDFFQKEQILLVNFDDLINDGINTIHTIESFIGVNLTSEQAWKEIYSNEAGVAATQSAIRKKLDMIRNIPVIKHLVDFSFNQRLRQKIRKNINNKLDNSILVKKMAKSKVSKLDRFTLQHCDKISKFIETDLTELESFWNRDLGLWRSSKKLS